MPAPEPEEEVQPAFTRPITAADVAPIPEPGFRNPVSIRIALIAALVSLFASVLSAPVPLLSVVWLVAGGFLAVYLYSRRTGLPLTFVSGARMGWITGLFAFLPVLILFTTGIVAISDQGASAELVRQMQARGAGVDAEAALAVLRNPAGVIAMVVMFFVIFTLFPAIGGALGAKVLGGRRP